MRTRLGLLELHFLPHLKQTGQHVSEWKAQPLGPSAPLRDPGDCVLPGAHEPYLSWGEGSVNRVLCTHSARAPRPVRLYIQNTSRKENY